MVSVHQLSCFSFRTDFHRASAPWMRPNRHHLLVAKNELRALIYGCRQHQAPLSTVQVDTEAVKPDLIGDSRPWHSTRLWSLHEITHLQSWVELFRDPQSGSLKALAARSVSKPVLQTLIVALVLTWHNCGNSILAGIDCQQIQRLLSAMKAAARLVCPSRKYDHITPLLESFHWLNIPEQIEFRLDAPVFHCLNDMAPMYLTCEVHCVVDIEPRQRLRSASSTTLDAPLARGPTKGDQAVPVAAEWSWNRLPIRDAVFDCVHTVAENGIV